MHVLYPHVEAITLGLTVFPPFFFGRCIQSTDLRQAIADDENLRAVFPDFEEQAKPSLPQVPSFLMSRYCSRYLVIEKSTTGTFLSRKVPRYLSICIVWPSELFAI